jgi:hypothetical protein
MNKLHTLQLYHEQVTYLNVSWTSYIPYNYIMNKLHTLQLYHEQVTHLTTISWTSYIPYSYIMNKLHTLQLYHEKVTYLNVSWTSYIPYSYRGGSRGGGAPGAPPPPPLKSEKIWFFGVKSWFFTRNTPKIFAPPSARCIFFKCAPPNLKSWIRPSAISWTSYIPYNYIMNKLHTLMYHDQVT